MRRKTPFKMLWICLIFVFISIVRSSDVREECAESGFVTDSLFCSTCDELSNFVNDSDLVKQCKQCCTDDTGAEEQTQ